MCLLILVNRFLSPVSLLLFLSKIFVVLPLLSSSYQLRFLSFVIVISFICSKICRTAKDFLNILVGGALDWQRICRDSAKVCLQIKNTMGVVQ